MIENSRLQKSIGVHAYNRPIKIAYLAPIDENELTHWILDAIFYESYTRWGGANTLIIPTRHNQFAHSDYEHWLSCFDPDYVYSYLTLDKEFVQKINAICLPISFLGHQKLEDNFTPTKWRDFLPEWDHYFKSVKSLSTILSPRSNPLKFSQAAPSPIKTLLTQSIEPSSDRFFPDNFGTSHDLSVYTNPVPGLYNTLCHSSPQTPGSRIVYGTKESSSIPEILTEIANGNVYTFATLARTHSDGLKRVEPHSWAGGFFLFVGETCRDRINFWNSRLLVPSWVENPGSLLVKKSAFDDDAFVTALGNYLNKYNFTRNGGGPPIVELRSLSEGREEIEKVHERFNRKTWSDFSIPTNFNAEVCPTQEEVRSGTQFARMNATVFRLTESSNDIQAESPSHFEYNLGTFSHLNKGAWAIDLDIERHNNLSGYLNVADKWQLPRRLNACSAFTNQPSKVTKENLLTIIPTATDHFLSRHSSNKRIYTLRLPSDLKFFQYLVSGGHVRNCSDLRYSSEEKRHFHLSHSDKGQNLRGIISMFEKFEDSYKLLTNKFWRDALRRFGRNDSNHNKEIQAATPRKKEIRYENVSVTESKLFSLIPSERGFLDLYSKKFHIERKSVNKYLKLSLSDSLEHLVERRVLFQIYEHRCRYCGHINHQTIDNLKKENKCSICQTKFFAPIDLEWKFKFNDFVSRSLVVNNGLTVLWALGYLHQLPLSGSFYYLPEVNLSYEAKGKEERQEIDILSVRNGKYVMGEVKKTVTSFTRKEGEVEKFISKVKMLRPDFAFLIFEDYTANIDEIDQVQNELDEKRTKIVNEAGISPSSLKIVIASERSEFNKYDYDLGVNGPRLAEFNIQRS